MCCQGSFRLFFVKAADTLVQLGKKDEFEKPTYSHFALTALERGGLLHYYVQQNHDGLPQKACFPQEKINEIHGAWYT